MLFITMFCALKNIHPGIGHKNIQPAKCINHLSNQLFQILLFCNICLHIKPPTPLTFYSLHISNYTFIICRLT